MLFHRNELNLRSQVKLDAFAGFIAFAEEDERERLCLQSLNEYSSIRGLALQSHQRCSMLDSAVEACRAEAQEEGSARFNITTSEFFSPLHDVSCDAPFAPPLWRAYVGACLDSMVELEASLRSGEAVAEEEGLSAILLYRRLCRQSVDVVEEEGEERFALCREEATDWEPLFGDYVAWRKRWLRMFADEVFERRWIEEEQTNERGDVLYAAAQVKAQSEIEYTSAVAIQRCVRKMILQQQEPKVGDEVEEL